MAGHDDSGSDKLSEAMDLPIFNAEKLQNNMKIIYYCRTFLSIIGGVTAGILGFTGVTGFIFYLIIMAITSVGLIAKTGFSVHSYFDSWNQVVLDGFLGGLMSFVLFWTYPFLISFLSLLQKPLLEIEVPTEKVPTIQFQEVISLAGAHHGVYSLSPSGVFSSLGIINLTR